MNMRQTRAGLQATTISPIAGNGNSLEKIHRDAKGQVALIPAELALMDLPRAKLSLNDSELRYRRLFEAAQDGILLLDAQTGMITDVNPYLINMLGYSYEEMLERRLWEVSPFKDSAANVGKFKTLHKNAYVRYDDLPLQTKSGQLRQVEFVSNMYTVGDDTVIQCNIRDTTARVEAEKALSRSEAKYRSLFELANDSIFIIDPSTHRILDANTSAGSRLGYTGEELLAMTVEDLAFPSASASVEGKVTGAAQSGGSTFEHIHRRKDGSAMPVEISAKPVTCSGTSVIQVIVRDITERKRAEAETILSAQDLQLALEETVQAMALVAETKDPYTAGHQVRVTKLSSAIAAEMGLSEGHRTALRLAASVHDIGKIGVPAEILAKPGRVSEMEFNLIQSHARVGHQILSSIRFPWPVAQIVLQHHERINGSGYPQGLGGADILVEARIIAVADVVEAMSSHRPYRPSLGLPAVLAEISRYSGILFDSAVVEACLKLFADRGFRFEEELPGQRAHDTQECYHLRAEECEGNPREGQVPLDHS